MAGVTVALAQAIREVPTSVMEEDLMWWLDAMTIAKEEESEDFYVLLAEYPCYCEQLEDKTNVCASCHSQVIVSRRIFATREVGHESSDF